MQLGDRLRELRKRAGYATGKAFAERLEWAASKVSRIENGQQLPADSDLRQWLEAASASESVEADLYDQLLEIRIEQDSWRRQLRRGHTPRQEYSREIETKARQITYVELNVVPGIVQTADYARAVLLAGQHLHESPADTETAVLSRMRRQEVLYDPSKKITILVTEAGLENPICPPEVMAPQLVRMQGLIGIAHVRFGIVPLGVKLEVVPMHGFVIVDDLVLVEITHAELTVAEPADVKLYRRVTELLFESAAEGEEARKILVRVGKNLGGS